MKTIQNIFLTLILTFLITNLFLLSRVSGEKINDKSLLSSCCIGIRGNVDNDVLEQIDISDLVFLVDFIFSSGTIPICLEEANIDADIEEKIDISDLVFLVDFIFNSGVTPNNCPNNDPIITWEKTFGGTHDEGGQSACETSDGGYIITGSTLSFGADRGDVYLVKSDKNGTLVWEKTFGGAQGDNGNSVCETSDGGYIIVGYTYAFGAVLSDVYVIKTDSLGTLIWEKTFGGTHDEKGQSVCETSDGGYIITGFTRSFGAADADVYLIKIDNNGTLLWEKVFGGANNDYGNSVCETSDSGYIITGATESFGAGDYDVYLIKTDSMGTLVWEKTFGGIYDNWGESGCETSDGDYIITGMTSSIVTLSSDVYLIKIDNNGTLLWEKTFGGTEVDLGFSVCETFDGDYIITGMTSSIVTLSSDVYLIKTDSSGTSVWEKTFGGSNNDYAFSVCETSDSGYIITGHSESFGAGDYNVYLIKTDSDGNVF